MTPLSLAVAWRPWSPGDDLVGETHGWLTLFVNSVQSVTVPMPPWLKHGRAEPSSRDISMAVASLLRDRLPV